MPMSRRIVSPAFLLTALAGATAFGCSQSLGSDPVAKDEANLGIGGQCDGDGDCAAIAHGKNAFTDRNLQGLGGNGRSCADCHMPDQSFQLSPASVQARWDHATQSNADDPLFRPIDADDFRTNGQNASDFTTLREMALVRVTIQLNGPGGNANAEVLDPVTGTWGRTADVWRATPSIMDVKLTGADGANPWLPTPSPNNTGGYQLDARQATLQAQARGAFFGHAEIQNEPSQELLDNIAAYENTVFSSDRTKAVADAIANGQPVPSADPPLNEQEARGKVIFQRACGFCHGGNGQSTTSPPVARFHDINTACPRPVDAQVPARWQYDPCPPQVANKIRTYRFLLPNGTYVTRASSDPGRALLAGAIVGGTLPNGNPRPGPADDWRKLDVPTLRNLKNTAPYFHNNSAPDIAAVLRHYFAFANFVFFGTPRLPNGNLPPVISSNGVDFDRNVQISEREDITAYLNTL
jgi:cytochrome c peroxidase